MRTAREKMVGRDCYYHVCGRLAGAKDDYPLTDVDKETGFQYVHDLSRLFFVEVISLCYMGNHTHCVLFISGEHPSLEEVAKRHNEYYGKKKPELCVEHHRERLEELADQLTDLSQFMRQLNQKYTFYYNRAHNRRGTLWADRFKSTILEGRSALWNCVKYVELNPQRAHMVEDPADYRFCSWGRFCGSGKHPFHANFVKHMTRAWTWEDTSEWTEKELFSTFRAELARVMAAESGVTSEEIHEAAETARNRGDSMPLKFTRRTRHWVDGGIIGSKAFVQEVGSCFRDKEVVLKKQLSRGVDTMGGVLHCFKRLRVE